MSSSLPRDTCLGAYRLVREVGSGGMGVVYEAWDTRLERRVAIKTIHPHLVANREMGQRLLDEARSAARIEHPNVVRIYRVEHVDGQVLIEMEFVEGTPLTSTLRARQFTLSEGVGLLRQTLEALMACHEKGVIHCDLKPANLLVRRNKQICLTDFGVARVLHCAANSAARESNPAGPVWGTPHYSPPEAWQAGSVTPAWDLYGAGALAFEALTGTPPFDAPTPTQLAKKILTESPPPLRSLCPEASPALSELVAALLARDPSQRPQSARAALDQLRSAPEFRLNTDVTQPLDTLQDAASPETAKNVISTESTTPRSRRKPVLIDLGIIAACVLVACGLLVWQQVWNSDDPALIGPTSDSGPANLFSDAGTVYFTDEDPQHGRELWCTNGSQGGRKLVADLTPGPQSSNPRNFMKRPFGGSVFTATIPDTGSELWYLADTGGGNASVRLIKDVIPGAMGSDPKPMAAYETQIAFYATTLNEGRELWCTNGLEPQTAMIADIHPGRQGSQPTGPGVCAAGSGLYILGMTDAARGQVLLQYDFNANTLREIIDVSEDTGGMAVLHDRLFFANQDRDHGMELWVYDPTADRAQMLADLRAGPESSGPGEFFQWHGRVYFWAHTDDCGLELWSSDGTPEGTRLVKDINTGPGDSSPYGFTDAGDTLIFRAKSDALGREPWLTDGTPEGTRCLADIRPGPADSTPYNLVAGAGWFFFSADDGVHGEELWAIRLGDTEASPKLVQDLYPGSKGSEPHELVWLAPGHGVFAAALPNSGPQLIALRYSENGFVLEPI